MSAVNIKRAVENIKSVTTVYTPIIEVIVNAIQAIESKNNNIEGQVRIIVKRSPEMELDESLPPVVGFEVVDNGIGFTEENRKSFDTLYSDYKSTQGGKGFGRFTCLKYFEKLSIESVYEDSQQKMRREFTMGHGHDIIENEVVTSSTHPFSYSKVRLESLVKDDSLNKKLSTIAANLAEKLLPYFITKNYVCPQVILVEEDCSNEIILNDYVNGTTGNIRELNLKTNSFSLGLSDEKSKFELRAFKIYAPKNRSSKISLVADKREVTETPIHNYIPEFSEEFYEKKTDGSNDVERNYIIKTYVFSDYLDKHVSLERVGFEFQKETDALYGISQTDIERMATEITKDSVIDEISIRQDKKLKTIQNYVEQEAPWHKAILKEMDLSSFPYNPNNEEIEAYLQKKKYLQEIAIRRDVNAILSDQNIENVSESVAKIVTRISDSSRNDLIHYIALRRSVLDLFKKSLEIDDAGKYSAEEVVHDIIFPLKQDSESINYDSHNLWIIDERLNFTNYITSDIPLNGSHTERPDVIVYNHRIAFRGDNESSNPITIFEFKKPFRDDFVNPSSQEDPIQQIIRYVNNIRADKYRTPEGRKINVAENTPFYGYVICDLSKKVQDWLLNEKNCKQMADGMGWFVWYENINLYIEVISWDKLLKDAEMRNKIFFRKLGI